MSLRVTSISSDEPLIELIMIALDTGVGSIMQ